MEWSKTSGIAMAFGQNHYQVWNGKSRLGLLGTQSQPLPSLEWWETFETAMTLGRNHYQVWKTSGTAIARLGRNHYPI